jgi:hypothetical protein
MAVAYQPTRIDFSDLAGIGQNIGGAIGQHNLGTAMKDAMTNGVYDYDKMIKVLAGRRPELAAKLATDRMAAESLAGYRRGQLGVATENAKSPDVQLLEWAGREGYLGGGGVEPFRLGPDGGSAPRSLDNAPSVIQEKVLPIDRREELKEGGKLKAERADMEYKKTAYSRNAESVFRTLRTTIKGVDNNSFENALGPFQGGQTSWLGSADPRSMVAQQYGAIRNAWEGGKESTSEVRDLITGSVEAVGAAIKPMVKLKGDPWTDSDQQRLINIVGALQNSKTKEEFDRRLGYAVDRINDAWGLKIDKSAILGDGAVAPAGPEMDMAIDPPPAAPVVNRVPTVSLGADGQPIQAGAGSPPPVTTDMPPIPAATAKARQAMELNIPPQEIERALIADGVPPEVVRQIMGAMAQGQ